MGERRKPGTLKKAVWLAEYLLILLVIGFIKLLPFPLAVRFGGFLGSLAYKIDKRHQGITRDNLRSSFKDKPPEEIERIALAVFRNFGYSIIEFIRSGRYGKKPLEHFFDIRNYESYQRALDKKRGLLLLTGHCGSWELLAMAQSIRKPPIGIVARPLDNPYLEGAVSGVRTRYGNYLIGKSGGMKDILRALSQNSAVGILLDQNVTAREGVFVDFFGRPACTNKGLALIAARTKSPVVPAFIRRVGIDRHVIHIGEEIPLIETGDKEADIIANTQAYTRAIEDFIREYPDQWFWMHRRWKSKPEGA